MKFLCKMVIFLFMSPIFAQVGINTTTPNAQLEIQSSNQTTPAHTDGLIIPRVDTFPSVNPTFAQQGMMVYLTTAIGTNEIGFYYWDNPSTTWIPIGNNSKNAWKTTGNVGTNPTNNFIGTIDDNPLSFRLNNTLSGRLEANTTIGNTSLGFQTLLNNTGTNNTAFGYRSLFNNSNGNENTSIGRSALYANTTGGGNVAMGYRAAYFSATGNENVAIGKESMENDTGSFFNVAVGYRALRNSIGGNENTAIGVGALELGSISERNTAVGRGAMFNFGTARNNTAIGFRALSNQTFTNGGTHYDSNNTAIGYEALFSNNPTTVTNGNRNVGIGFQALRANTTGYGNTALGFQSLVSNTTGFQNIGIGDVALVSNTIGTRNIGIGAGSLYGNTTGTNNIGIGFDALRLQSFDNGGIAYTPANIAIGTRSLYNNQPTSLTNGNRNVAVGYETLRQNTIGAGNTAIGFQSLLLNTTGIQNVGMGDVALASNTIGSQNIGIGVGSLYSNTTSTNNIAIGTDALRLQSFDNGNANFDSSNIALGTASLYNNNPSSPGNGSYNIAIGGYSLHSNTTGSFNIGIGRNSLRNSIGMSNIGLGVFALENSINGVANIAIGTNSNRFNLGSYNTSIGDNSSYNTFNYNGSNNVYLGSRSGFHNNNGSDNTFLGYNAGPSIGNTNLQYAVAIGSEALVSASNSIALGGNTATTRTRVGINNPSPLSDLDIRQSSGTGTNQGSGGINLGNGVFHWRIYNSSNLVRFNYSNDSGATYTPMAFVSATNGSWNQLSDATMKRDLKPLDSVLRKLEQLNPVSYFYIHNSMNDKRSIGFLAQEVAQLFPESVSKDEVSDVYGIDYSSFAVYAIKAIQEQQEIIKNQENKIVALEERLNAIELQLKK